MLGQLLTHFFYRHREIGTRNYFPPHMERRPRRIAVSSVARVLQCDTLTTNWLRGLRAAAKADVVSPYVDPDKRKSGLEVSASPAKVPCVPTPLHFWVGPTLHVCYTCSFCQTALQKGSAYVASFNHTLTTPVVLTCVTCSNETLNEK